MIPYGQVGNFHFIDYDDNRYITENRQVLAGLTVRGLIWSLEMGGYASNWHPLTWLSHMTDMQLFGLNAGCHHRVNLFFHLLNTVLLFLLLRSLTGTVWRSAFVAALFGLHPMHVESVAWVSERKDVLSTLLWIITMGCYVNYVRRRGVGRYLLVLLFFALGLLAKPMLVSLPFVLLLIDFWPFNRFAFLRWQESGTTGSGTGAAAVPSIPTAALLAEKIPLLILAIVSCVVTLIVQQRGGALTSLEALPFPMRLVNAITAYGLYVWKMAAPVRMAFLYPLPLPFKIDWPALIGSAVFLIGVTLVAVKTARRMPYLITGWLWFTGTMAPVIGLVQLGSQALADRYTYIPYIGLFIMIAWAVPERLAGFRYKRMSLVVASTIILIALAAVTGHQARYWRDSLSLFEHAIAVTGNNYIAHNGLGNVLAALGRREESIGHYQTALRLNPIYFHAYNNLGAELADMGRLDEAIANYEKALRIDPGYAYAHYNLGSAFLEKGWVEKAISEYQTALDLQPDNVNALNNLGKAYLESGRPEAAIACYVASLRRDPDYTLALENLGTVLVATGEIEQTAERLLTGTLSPRQLAGVYNSIAASYLKSGHWESAEPYYRKALELDPGYTDGLHELGRTLVLNRKYREAAVVYGRLIAVKPDDQNALRQYAYCQMMLIRDVKP